MAAQQLQQRVVYSVTTEVSPKDLQRFPIYPEPTETGQLVDTSKARDPSLRDTEVARQRLQMDTYKFAFDLVNMFDMPVKVTLEVLE